MVYVSPQGVFVPAIGDVVAVHWGGLNLLDVVRCYCQVNDRSLWLPVLLWLFL